MTSSPNAMRLGAIQIAICVLAVATAAVHIYLGVITHVMVVTQPEATAAAGGAAALGSSPRCSTSMAWDTSC